MFCSDSRTNAGIDDVSTHSKMHLFVWPGERVFVLPAAGNLATTQAVVKKLKGDVPAGLVPDLLSANSAAAPIFLDTNLGLHLKTAVDRSLYS